MREEALRPCLPFCASGCRLKLPCAAVPWSAPPSAFCSLKPILIAGSVPSPNPPAGRIRNKAEVDDAAVDAILSLNIISAKYLRISHSSHR